MDNTGDLDTTISLASLGLSTRATNVLLNASINSFEILDKLSYDYLLQIPKLGQVTAAEILRKISAFKRGIQPAKDKTIKITEKEMGLEISVLSLNNREFQSLKNANIITLGDLSKLDVKDLLKLKGLGEKGILNIIQAVDLYYLEKYKLNDCAIDNLSLDNRTLNALRKNDIFYVSQLVNMSREEISNLRGIGGVSLDKLSSQIKAKTGKELMGCKELRISDPMLSNKKITLEALDFSKRSLNALINNGFCYVEEIITLKDSEFLALKKIGQRSLQDIKKELSRFLGKTNNNSSEKLTTLDAYFDLLQIPLSTHQKDIINRRLGTYSQHTETLESIARDYNLSRERIRQIEKIAKKKVFSLSNCKTARPLFTQIDLIFAKEGGVLETGNLIAKLTAKLPAVNINSANIIPILVVMAGYKEILEGVWASKETDTSFIIKIQNLAKIILTKRGKPIPKSELVEAVSMCLQKEGLTPPATFIEACITSSRSLKTDTFAMVFLVEWQYFIPQSRIDYVKDVLESLDRPAHYKEITLRINEMLPKEAQYSEKSIQVILGSSDLFVRVKTGTYALAKWREKTI